MHKLFKKDAAPRTLWGATYWIVMGAGVMLAAYLICHSVWFSDMVETYQYDRSPSAQRAFDIGERHFDSSRYPQSYDIDRAEYYFKLALEQDPTLPYVFHELSRIAFLRGDFPLALAYIDFQIQNEGDATPNSFYVRALIEGFAGDYPAAEADYARYIAGDPINWAATNDYSWVLLKDNKPKEADAAIGKVLQYFPDNPWLLNSDAIALSEMGDASTARTRLVAASAALSTMTDAQWSSAYPGNDPGVAATGLDAFKEAVDSNIHSIDAGKPIPAVQ